MKCEQNLPKIFEAGIFRLFALFRFVLSALLVCNNTKYNIELNLKSFKKLRKLDFNIEIDNLNELLIVLNLLENVFAKKAMKVTGSITIIQDPHGLDEKGTLDIFRRALELINEKFPRKSTELKVA